MGWSKLANGELLRSAADAAFDVFISIDKNLRHQQNLNTLPLPIVVLNSVSNALPALIPFAPRVLELFEESLQKILHLIESDGRIVRLGAPEKP